MKMTFEVRIGGEVCHLNIACLPTRTPEGAVSPPFGAYKQNKYIMKYWKKYPRPSAHLVPKASHADLL